MRTLQYNFTTPEQSERLLELGVPADSADCFIAQYSDGGYCPLPGIINDEFQDREWLMRIGIPCWSVGRLMELWMIYNSHYSIPVSFVLDRHEQNIVNTIIDMLVGMKADGVDFSKLED